MKGKNKKTAVTKLHESIHLLNVMQMGIETDVQTLKALASSNIDAEHLASVNYLTFKHGIIQVQSYLDEYRNYFLKALNKDQKKKIEPFYSRINKELVRFPGMKKYRNNALAHNLRTDNRNSIFLHGDFRLYRVPQNLKEYMYILHCLSALSSIINTLFPNMYDEALKAVKERQERNKTPYMQMLSDEELTESLKQLEKDLEVLANAS